MEHPNQPCIIKLPKICDPSGNLTFVEGDNHLPFRIARAFWIYDVPAGEDRGSHSHRRLQQFIVAMSGSFDIKVTDGFTWKEFHLNRPFEGLYVPPGFWNTLQNFATSSVCLTLASAPYDEADYIRDFEVFKAESLKIGPRL